MKQEVILNDQDQATEVVAVAGKERLAEIDQGELLRLIKQAQTADVESAPEAGIKYWDAGEGKELKGVFRGWKAHTLKDGDRAGEVIFCPVIQVSEYMAYISMAVALVGAFETIPENTSVYVRCDEAKSGQAAKFTVKVLS